MTDDIMWPEGQGKDPDLFKAWYLNKEITLSLRWPRDAPNMW